MFTDASSYVLDTWQRSVLFLDVMRQRAIQYREHAAESAPHVLDFEAQLVCDGRTLERPVNYGLVRIVSPQGIVIDDRKRPFVVVDPGAGHGPGIGGFKADSEIGVAMKAGHPCHLIGFLPETPARPDHRGHCPCRGGLSRNRHRPPSRGRRKALRDRQLSGRLGRHDPGGASPGALRADHRGRLSSFLLGGREGPEPDALYGRPARWQLADGADRRSRRRRVRRRLAGAEFREPEPGQHALDEAIRSLLQDRYRGRALSRLRAVLGGT